MAAVLLLAGAALSYRHGRVGFMPLDQSIVFDGAWRLLGGQVPYRDFVLPNGLAPIAIQAAVSAPAGPTWRGYLLHAAVVNGLFAAIVFLLLRSLGLGRAPASVYAAGSAVVLYPPFGAPFMDQHAFFFALGGVAAAILGARAADDRSARRWGVVLGLCAWAALLAKQLPTALLPLALGAVWLAAGPGRRAATGRAGLLTALVAGAALVLLAVVAGVPASAVRTYAFELPGEVGRERIASLAAPGALVRAAREAHRAWGLWSVAVVVLGALALLPAAARAGKAGDRRGLLAILLAPALLAVCLAHAVLTYNQPHNAIPYAFAAMGLLHLAAITLLDARLVRTAVGGALLAIALRDAWDFETRVNAPRRVHKLDRRAAPRFDDPALPAALRPMAWWTPSEHAQEPRDLADTAAFLRSTGARFFLLGDTSVLYALTGQPSAGPVLWFHAGLTYPRRDHPAFPDFERRLMDALARERVEYVVLEGDRTYMRTTLADFPALEGRVRRSGCEPRRFGVFTVIRLCG